MAAGFNHPNVKVHVGDGFKFLDDYKNTFDVIITDSSDPEGPAESLFQSPYFQLLHDALREGGVITTQGCMSHLLEKVETWEDCLFPWARHPTCLHPPCAPSLRRLPSGTSKVSAFPFVTNPSLSSPLLHYLCFNTIHLLSPILVLGSPEPDQTR